MARRDPMEVLRRLRGLQVLAARRKVAERLGEALRAEADAAEAATAMCAEAAMAERPADYALWLPRGLALRDRRAAEQARAEAALAAARGALAAARAAEHAVEQVLERKREAEAEEKAHHAQLRLDEIAARRG